MKTFASDNYSGIHPAVLESISKVNVEHARSYGYDETTAAAEALFRKEFGGEIAVFFVLTGTAANVLGIKTLAQPYDGVICARESHLNSDECGAPERFACKLLPVDARHGKLHAEDLASCFDSVDEHRVRPRVISISQSTEWGTVYTPVEIAALAEFAHTHDCYLHMDGARIANGAVSAGVSLKAMTSDAGVDVLSFGGTKNGIMCGEAVLFFNQGLAKDFRYIRKQGMQLSSKMRFISAQFVALLSGELWKKNAAHANAMARLLAESIRGNASVKIVEPVEANVVFAQLASESILKIREQVQFYTWKEAKAEKEGKKRESIVRWMTAFDTTAEEVCAFAELINRCTAK